MGDNELFLIFMGILGVILCGSGIHGLFSIKKIFREGAIKNSKKEITNYAQGSYRWRKRVFKKSETPVRFYYLLTLELLASIGLCLMGVICFWALVYNFLNHP